MSFFAPDPPVEYRPLSLSILGWYLTINGPFALVPLLIGYTGSPALDMWEAIGIDPQYLMAMSLTSGIVHATAGVAILKRIHWGRTLYLVFTPLQIVASAIFLGPFAGSNLISAAIVFGGVFFLLTRPASNDYFDGTVLEEPERVAALRIHRRAQGSSSDLGRVLAVILGGLGTLLIMMVPVLIATGIAAVQKSPSVEEFFLGAGGIFLGLTAGCLVVGTLLWGAKRLKAYLGWILVAGGLWALVGSFSMEQIANPEFWDRLPTRMPGDPEEVLGLLRRMMATMKVGGLVFVSIGAPLVWFQRVADQAAVEEE